MGLKLNPAIPVEGVDDALPKINDEQAYLMKGNRAFLGVVRISEIPEEAYWEKSESDELIVRLRSRKGY